MKTSIKLAKKILLAVVSIIIILILATYIGVMYKIKQANNDNILIIAHAGGKINNDTYTDSLEALNNSYQAGAKYFELDISTTKDGYYVATHDWLSWAHSTHYHGSLPPDLATFKATKILGKYTPISFENINQWFQLHPDATLVTDKIDDPQQVTTLFVDKSRLRMELFSKASMMAGGQLFDGAMANVYALNGDQALRFFTARVFFIPRILFLKQNNIHYVVTGAPESFRDKFKLALLRAYGIKVYMYLFGSDKDIDQQIQQYRNYLDGVYYNKIPS